MIYTVKQEILLAGNFREWLELAKMLCRENIQLGAGENQFAMLLK
jgi:hypothetical protein